jgi:site-specific recombinase XerC
MTNGPVSRLPVLLPPILAGQSTPETRERVEEFYFSVAAIFETWVKRRQSKHTRRAYREDIMAFVNFADIAWPGESVRLLAVSITDVQRFRDSMIAAAAAPKTLNRRISSLSSFFKYLHGRCCGRTRHSGSGAQVPRATAPTNYAQEHASGAGS